MRMNLDRDMRKRSQSDDIDNVVKRIFISCIKPVSRGLCTGLLTREEAQRHKPKLQVSRIEFPHEMKQHVWTGVCGVTSHSVRLSTSCLFIIFSYWASSLWIRLQRDLSACDGQREVRERQERLSLRRWRSGSGNEWQVANSLMVYDTVLHCSQVLCMNVVVFVSLCWWQVGVEASSFWIVHHIVVNSGTNLVQTSSWTD